MRLLTAACLLACVAGVARAETRHPLCRRRDREALELTSS
jgi:hypothetical protein